MGPKPEKIARIERLEYWAAASDPNDKVLLTGTNYSIRLGLWLRLGVLSGQ